jgi:ABC-type spermidine/putrescine transport system permease subunit II
MIELIIKKYRAHRLLLVGMLLFMYIPILYLLVASFHESPYTLFPYQFTIDNYIDVFEGEYGEELWNSLRIGFGSGLISMIMGAAAAWGVVRYQFRLRYAITASFVLPMIVPTLITGIGASLFHSQVTGFTSSTTLATITQSVRGTAFAFLIMMTQLSQYPVELDQAAEVYGASRVQRLREVTLPLVWGALLGAFLIATIISFNNYNLTFFTVGSSGTIPTLTFAQLRYGLEPSLFALSTLIAFVSLAVIFLLSVLIELSEVLEREQ